MHLHLPPLLVVLAIAVAAPLIAEATRRIGLAVVVLELLLGVAIGPQGLAWAAPEGAVPFLATFGMAFLFFLAGLEIDVDTVRGQPLQRALAGWAGILALACLAAYGLQRAGYVHAWPVVAVALSTTALGILMPILKDAGTLETPFGRHALAVGVVGEVLPILCMSVVLSRASEAHVQTAFTVAFLAVVLAIGWLLVRGAEVPGVLRFLRRTMTQSSQLPVRMSVLLVGVLVVLAELLGLDLALGALAAGMTIALATRGEDAHLLHHKLEAIGFGFLVPVFFVTSGMKLDVAAMTGSAQGLALVGLFLAALLAVRLPLVLTHRGLLPPREHAALGLYSATTLSLVVALAEIGTAKGLLAPSEAAPLVGGAMLSVILFPMVARLAGRTARPVRAYLYDKGGL
ncbi:MAG TPA: cation:proton antiporter [Burkholderiales bacterium]|nr:cation:proton antiporter [Burkholderiales bacterium]